ncbi:MAG: recombinase family protein [Planctomycetes bacterium]|nr:recombinase family protein [Planctomycetota bacterium]
MIQRSGQGRALFYTRDSGGKHEQTPAEYVGWAQRRARELGLRFSGTAESIDAMMQSGCPESGDLFFDFCVQGHLLSRPALDALKAEIVRDRDVSHVFIPRRDRLARPDDPLDGLKLENELRGLGITLVYMTLTLAPRLKNRRPDVGEAIVGIFDFDQSGRFRQNLAETMIFAQLGLAKSGFSTGGRPPFGYRRWLVDAVGNRIRELEKGEIVRKQGHHVMWLPGPEAELDLIRRILAMLELMPATEVARRLTAEGIRSPDADRVRTDNGVKHQVLGVWHATTITGIARQPLNRALVEYGRRSMGDQLRMTADGPRCLEEQDSRADGKPKVIQNPAHLRVVVPAKFDPIIPAVQYDRLISILDQRAGTQRGKPRSRDPGKNPLGSRIHDLGCSWPMYRQPHGKSFRYTCGLYQQSHGEKCAHNHVDGLTATRFVLRAIRQRLLDGNRLHKLQDKIEARARAELNAPAQDSNLDAKRAELAQLLGQLARIQRNLALAESDELFGSISEVFAELKSTALRVEREVASLERLSQTPSSVETEVAIAIEIIARLKELAADASNLPALSQLFKQVNVQVYLRFLPVKKRRRTENKMTGGVLTWGNAPSPIQKYQGPTGRGQLRLATAQRTYRPDAINGSGKTDVVDSGGRDRSLGNVSRGDRI